MPVRRPRPGPLLARWALGTALVTWRYVWETTPLHRAEQAGDENDRPPELPAAVLDDQAQLSADGYGPLFRRRFQVRIADAAVSAEELFDHVIRDFKHFVPSEVVDIHTGDLGDRGLDVGDDFLVKMPGPWDGPVRVVHRGSTCLHLVTLRGHLEAGQVHFRAREQGGLLVFEIELWARPASRLVHLLYSRLRLAKEIQLNMWVRFCLAAVDTSGGRLKDGVHIATRWLGADGDPDVRAAA